MSNIYLRIAILQSGKKNFEIAREAKIHPTILSHLVNNHYVPTPKQKQQLSQVLEKRIDELFSDRQKEVE